jgi:hypothetical protein
MLSLYYSFQKHTIQLYSTELEMSTLKSELAISMVFSILPMEFVHGKGVCRVYRESMDWWIRWWGEIDVIREKNMEFLETSYQKLEHRFQQRLQLFRGVDQPKFGRASAFLGGFLHDSKPVANRYVIGFGRVQRRCRYRG